MHGQAVGVSAVSRTATDAMWKHTWSLSYVLPAEVLWHPPFDPRDEGRGPKNKGAGGGRCCHSLVTCGGENRGKENRNAEWQKAGVALEESRGEPAASRLMSLEEWAGHGGVLLEEVMRRRPPRLLHSGEVQRTHFFDLCLRFLISSARWKFLINVNACLSFFSDIISSM